MTETITAADPEAKTPIAAKTVSVVIPTKNEAAFIAGCLEGITAAARRARVNLQMLVVDNGSTDRTCELAEAGGADVLHRPKDSLGELRNSGAAAASGELIAFIDADCTPHENWLLQALAALETRGDAARAIVAVGAYPRVPPRGSSWVQRTWATLCAHRLRGAGPATWLPTANLIVRASAFRAVDGFDPRLVSCEDADLCYRLAREGEILCDADIAVDHHREPRTLHAFFKKEVWHGASSYDRLLAGSFSWAEAPSLLLPIAFWTGLVLAVAAASTRSPVVTVLAGIALAGPPLLHTVRSVIKKGGPHRAPQYLVLHTVYMVARGIALAKRATRPEKPVVTTEANESNSTESETSPHTH